MPDDLKENGMPLNDWRDLPEITRIINSTFSFYGNYQIKGINSEKIKRKMFIKAFTENGSWQYFRIKTAKKNLNGIAITATHIGYEANRNFITSVFVDKSSSEISTKLILFKTEFGSCAAAITALKFSCATTVSLSILSTPVRLPS